MCLKRPAAEPGKEVDMTNKEAIWSGKIPIEHVVCGFRRLCGICQADRKICNAELNCGCGKQWLQAEYRTDFVCDYKKPGVDVVDNYYFATEERWQ